MSEKTGKSLTAVPLISEALFKKIFLGVIAVMFVLLPLLSIKSGINADIKYHAYITRYIVPFYTSFGGDERIFLTKSEVLPTYQKGGIEALEQQYNIDMVPQEDNFYQYGGGFEFFAGMLSKMFGVGSDKQLGFHTVTHVLLGIVTALILLFSGLTAKELGGWRAALITVVLLLVSPRFTGHGLMNNKDIPFALGYIIAAYFVLRFLKQLPRPTWKMAVGVMIGFAAALSIRVGGLLLFFYFGLFCIGFWAYFSMLKKDPAFNFNNLKAAVIKALVASFAGYVLGLVLWPYGIIDPIGNPLEVLKAQSEFPTFINQLFEGQVVSSKDLPWYYQTKFIGITSPLVVLLGIGLFLGLFYKFREVIKPIHWLFIAFIIVFPLAYIAKTNANVYNAWRHVIFVYPPLVVLSALGFDLLLRLLKPKGMRVAVGGVMAFMCLWPAYWTMANVPYQYTYFNPIVGGTSGAHGYYVTDYWMIGVREAAEWLVEDEQIGSKGQVVVATDCAYPTSTYLNAMTDNVKVIYLRYYGRTDRDWDYGIFYSEYVKPSQLQNGLWPPDGTIYTVEAGGAPIVAVVKRQNKLDYQAMQLSAAGKFAEAIPVFEKALQTYPNNEMLYSGLGLAYLNVGQMEKAKAAFSSAIQKMPDDPSYYYYLAVAYLQSSTPDVNAASMYLNKALELNPGFQQAAQLLQQINGGR